MGHYYAATLKPSLAGLDPAQKAAAIGGYVADTGIAPDAALKTLLGLTATGDAEGRIAATRELVAVFDTDPTARNKVPPGLAAYAETLVDLADTYELAPDEAVKTADALFGDSTPGADRPNPALLQLVSAKNTGVQPDVQADAADEDDATAPELTEDTEGDEDDVFFDEEDDGAAEALLEEFKEFRDALVDDGIDPETPIVGSVDTLRDAIARRDPDEIETRIGQLEDRVTEERTRLTDEAAAVQLASLEGFGPLLNPNLGQIL